MIRNFVAVSCYEIPQLDQAESRSHLNRRSVGHQLPDFIDLFIRYCDAAIGPISQTVRAANCSVTVREPVQKDISARRNVKLRRFGAVYGAWI